VTTTQWLSTGLRITPTYDRPLIMSCNLLLKVLKYNEKIMAQGIIITMTTVT